MGKARSLPESYHSIISRAIDADGVFPHNVITVDADGKTTMLALDLPIGQSYAAMAQAFRTRPKEMIWAFDRFAKAGQGTTTDDLLAGAYWDGSRWHPFIIEYCHEPRFVGPLNWANAFWVETIRKELAGL